MQAIILAGGKGTRLKPYTITLPKPLVPVGDFPILEIIIKQLKRNGFTKITLAVGHMAGLIEAYFGSGSKWDVEINYSMEEKPLGTAGPIKLIQNLEEDFLVMNSDDLTDFNYSEFFNYHKKNKSAVTIGAYNKKQKINLGVLKTDENNFLTDYIEKPEYEFAVSMGIYAFNKKVLPHIPENEYFDFPSLIKTLIKNREKVVSYEHKGLWLDIGRPEDYETANTEFEKFKTTILGE